MVQELNTQQIMIKMDKYEIIDLVKSYIGVLYITLIMIRNNGGLLIN